MELRNSDAAVIPIMIPDSSNLKTVNFFIVKQADSLSLIDAGWNNEACWNGFNEILNRNGFSIQDLTEIILTHHHIDHIGLVNRITSVHPIPVYAHEKSIPRLKRDKNFMEMRIQFFTQLYNEMGCGEMGSKQVHYLKNALLHNEQNSLEADITAIQNNKLLNFQVIDIPGHAPDQLAFYDPEQNFLFAGDLLIEHISSNALVEPDESGEKLPTLLQHADSLKRCLSLEGAVIFPGHGKIIERPGELITMRLERMEVKARRLIKLIDSGYTSGNEIARAYYKNTYYDQFSLVMSEIIGHLDYLEIQGKIHKEFVNGVWKYSVT